MKVYRPWAFQGSKKRKNYFEGWYFKHVSADRSQVWSFIPGISLSKGKAHSFIQTINGISGETQVHEYTVEDFDASSRELNIQVGSSGFSTGGMSLELINDSQSISGTISYGSMDPYPSTLFNPGIMGWYSFVPFMECKHGVVSMQHSLSGSLEMNGKEVDFEGGSGYIEKDWGTSFPESWIWLHCNTFLNSKTSFTFSVAKIPWLGSYFIGFISYLRLEDRIINFSTWSKARIEKLSYSENTVHLILYNKEYNLEVTAQHHLSGQLKAPVRGSMERYIKESVDADIELALKDQKGQVLFRDQGTRAGMEVIEKILEYF